MKLLTVLFAGVMALLSACILLPAPNLALLPLMIAAPELSPWLILLNLLASLVALRFHRRALPLPVAALLLSCWPVLQIHKVVLRSSTGGAEQVKSVGNTVSVLIHFLSGPKKESVKPERLPLHILFYPPPANFTGMRPALIDIYGGAWQHGSPGDMERFDSYVARRGVAVFAIDYRHAPAFRYPVQIEDVRAAISFVGQNAAKYRIDRERLVLCGRSAGAELALLAAYEPGVVPVRGVISYYGPTDLRRGYDNLPSPDPIHVREVLDTYLGGSPEQVPEAYRAASPVNYMRAALPATLLIQGERDHIVKDDFARELYERLRQSGNRVELLEMPWSEHGFDFVPGGLGNRIALPCVDEFLDKTLR